MSGLAARVAGPVAVRAIASEMSVLVARITDASASPRTSVSRFGTFASDMTRFVAIIARRLVGGLLTIFGDMSDTVATVTTIVILFAFAGEMTVAIAFVAFFPASVTASTVGTAAVASAGTFTSEMPGSVAFVTRRVHRCFNICLYSRGLNRTTMREKSTKNRQKLRERASTPKLKKKSEQKKRKSFRVQKFSFRRFSQLMKATSSFKSSLFPLGPPHTLLFAEYIISLEKKRFTQLHVH